MKQKLPLVGNRLKIANANRVRGILSIAFGVSLLAVVFSRRAVILASLSRLRDFANGSSSVDRYLSSPQAWAELVLLAIAAVGLLVGLRAIVRGGFLTLSFFVPVNVPANLAQQDLYPLLRDRTITTYEVPHSAYQRMAGNASQRLAYALPWKREMIDESASAAVRFVMITAALVAVVFFQGAISRALDFQLRLPLPWAFLLVMLLGVVGRAIVLMTMATSAPSADIVELRANVADAVHPTNLFHHLKEALDDLRYGNFRNRWFADQEPDVGTKQQEDVCSFSFVLGSETQPEPIPKWVQPSATLAGVSAFGFGVYSLRYALSSAPSAVAKLTNGASQELVLSIIAIVVTSVTSAKLATYFGTKQQLLSNLFRFRSRVCHIQMDGTMSVSHIGIGDGRGGTLQAHRPVVQSSGYLIVHSAELVSESYGLTGHRYIVSSYADDDFTDSIRQMLDKVVAHRDGTSRLPQIDMGTPELSSIVQASQFIQANTSSNIAETALPVNEKQQLDRIRTRRSGAGEVRGRPK